MQHRCTYCNTRPRQISQRIAAIIAQCISEKGGASDDRMWYDGQGELPAHNRVAFCTGADSRAGGRDGAGGKGGMGKLGRERKRFCGRGRAKGKGAHLGRRRESREGITMWAARGPWGLREWSKRLKAARFTSGAFCSRAGPSVAISGVAVQTLPRPFGRAERNVILARGNSGGVATEIPGGSLRVGEDLAGGGGRKNSAGGGVRRVFPRLRFWGQGLRMSSASSRKAEVRTIPPKNYLKMIFHSC